MRDGSKHTSTHPHHVAMTDKANERLTSMGIWAWLAIVEGEADKLSEGAQSALSLLREDLERVAEPESKQQPDKIDVDWLINLMEGEADPNSPMTDAERRRAAARTLLLRGVQACMAVQLGEAAIVSHVEGMVGRTQPARLIDAMHQLQGEDPS